MFRTGREKYVPWNRENLEKLTVVDLVKLAIKRRSTTKSFKQAIINYLVDLGSNPFISRYGLQRYL